MPQQLCSHPLPQLSKELHGVISALGNAQELCPEWETPRRHLPQHNTQGNPSESSPVPGRPLLTPAQVQQQPRASGCCGTAFLSQGRYSRSIPRSQPGAVPPAAGTSPCSLPSHAGSTDRSRGTSCPGRAGGVSKAMTEESLWWGQGCHGTNTAEQSPGCDCPQPCPRSLRPGREAPWQGRHPSELRGQSKGRREDQLGSNAGRSLWAWGSQEPSAPQGAGIQQASPLQLHHKATFFFVCFWGFFVCFFFLFFLQ